MGFLEARGDPEVRARGVSCPVKGCCWLTRSQEVARLVHSSEEQLESDDGVNDNDEKHQQGNVQQRHKRFHDGIEHYVQACGGEGQAQRVRHQRGAPPPTWWRGILTRDPRH